MAIDRAVLLPGQELMERMDREYNRTGEWKPRAEVEDEMRREKTEGQAEKIAEDQDPVCAFLRCSFLTGVYLCDEISLRNNSTHLLTQ